MVFTVSKWVGLLRFHQFFCILGMVIVGSIIFLSLDSHYHWTK